MPDHLLRETLRRTVRERLAEWYGVDPTEVRDDRPFAELGLTSRDAARLTAELRDLTGERLPATLVWEAPTLELLMRRLEDPAHRRPAGTRPRRRPARRPPLEVAVVGVGCRLPGGVDGPEAFWRLLCEGADAVGTVPEGRWEPFLPDGADLSEVSRHGGFLDDVAGFDAAFFGIPPSEAVLMDPQQRMLLEVAREALDQAAIPAPSLAGSRTGVFVGISGNEYARLTTAEPGDVDPLAPAGSALSIAANRLSYAMDLRGPSLAVDTACSSSLVAVHHAVRSLETGESDTALAAGANLLLSPAVTLAFQRAGALAPDGRCKPFAAGADGMVRGEGCGVVVLKRLADAERDGNRVLAVIRATAVNSDGRSNGLLAPSPEAQHALLAEAHAVARGGRELDYVEAHGTGTALGDPIEARALGEALGRPAGRDPEQPLLLGSVKSNVGHLEAAAGITGLIKAVLALHHDEIPPQLHAEEPSEHIDFDGLGLRVVASAEPWPRYSGRATAGVSAFGFGGTNAHVVLAEHEPAGGPDPRPTGAAAVLALDAPDAARLRSRAAELADWLCSPEARRAGLVDVARTLAGRAGRGTRRAAVVAVDRAEAADALAALAARRPHPALVLPSVECAAAPERAVWVFSGYGSQWAGMGRRLLEAEPAFAAAVERLEPLLRDETGLTLREHLSGDAELGGPGVVQPVLFGMQLALAELWRAYGVAPAAVAGHSMGEAAAAVVAGALSEADGARVIAVRSRLLDGLSGGAMAVVGRSSAGVGALAGDLPTVQVAVHASPEQCVVTGDGEEIAELLRRVAAEGGLARSLGVAGAGHSPQVEPLLAPLTQRLAGLDPRPPRLPCYGTVLDDPREIPAFDAAYWAANLRRPVRFAQAVGAAAGDGHRFFLEISPHPTQLHPLAETLAAHGCEAPVLLPTLRRGSDDAVAFRRALAGLLVHGVRLDSAALHRGGRIIDLPLARWEHRPYWIGAPRPEAAPPRVEQVAAAPDLTARLRALVAEVAGCPAEQVDPDAPLTDLGLDSLMAARVLARLRREAGIVVPPGELLRGGTLSAIAGRLGPPPGEPSGVLPRDASERLAARTWQAVSGEPAPGVEHRLPLEHLVRTAEELGLDPEQVRSGPPTLAALASLLRPRLEAPVRGTVRTFRATGERPPLFLVHPAGGSSAVYGALAERLGPDQPCHGLERLPDLREVRDRAAAYAEIIGKMSPEGPWVVGGWSYGGVVAQETACLLSGHGTVAALVLVDSVLPLPARGLTPEKEVRRRFAGFAAYVERTYGRPLPLRYDELAALDEETRIEHVVKELARAADLPPAVLEHQRTSYLDLCSGERHRPRRYPGRTLLYRATEPAPHTVDEPRYQRTDPALGWDAHCPDLTVAPLPGHHLELLDPPLVDTLAGLLTRDLTRLPTPDSHPAPEPS